MATELQTLGAPPHDATNDTEIEDPDRETLVQTLDAPDRGKEAYKFLFGAFVIEGFLWGEYNCCHLNVI